MDSNDKYKPSATIRIVLFLMILTGLAASILAYFNEPSRFWTNLLLSNYFFLSISIGALLFYSLQFITGSEWSAVILRIPLSMGSYLPFAALFMFLLYFGLPYVYEWAHHGIIDEDAVISHKEPFLNTPFFFIRMFIYFLPWILFGIILFNLARKQDLSPARGIYEKSAFYSKAFIFSAVILFSFASVDWIMTIDAHWYSTLFGFRNMVTSIYFAVAVIVLVLFFIKSKNHLHQLNKAHRHDLARYLFRFSIIFGYLWFMQFLIIWYANIPELTVYYTPRYLGQWQVFFYIEPVINFFIPFLVLMSDDLGRKKPILISISILLVIGLWISLFLQIMPGSYGTFRIGFTEVGTWIGFAGLFSLLLLLSLRKMELIPKNHPYLEKSINHHV